ncbi:hypothetical protein RHMOL_Rhmol13G0178800 [Rhododendron molle]|uniref:Uncharacterized protein n=1 Tax=Rhododendron molle TaxID=49168 RepID=A0ACC0L859_RHOML|nr:hypothetical protein RHMOL_Rhmol13G0178800 [Rhododendron molle]
MNCNSEDFMSNTSPMIEAGKVAICDPFPMSASLQPVLHPSNLVEPLTSIEASLVHPGSEVRNLMSKRITACWDNNFEITFNHVETLKPKCTPKCTLAFKDNNSVECGHLMARSALKLLRPTRTIRHFRITVLRKEVTIWQAPVVKTRVLIHECVSLLLFSFESRPFVFGACLVFVLPILLRLGGDANSVIG